MRALYAAVLVAACSTATPEPRPAPAAAPIDASDASVRPPAPPRAPSGTGHLDDDGAPRAATPPAQGRSSRPIDVILRSTPTEAQVAVDGIVIGATPAYWNGTADGREHEFTFVLPGHAIARYRFVPITSGTIHARLQPVSEDVNAGVPPPEVVPPTVRQPDSPPPPLPDAPLLAPPDAGGPPTSPWGPLQ